MNERQLSHDKRFSCFFMDLYEDRVLLPNGKESSRIYIEHPGAAAVLQITKEGDVLLIRQFRYPIRSVTIEIPAGKKDDPDETGLACVQRELEEETGHQSDRIEHVMDIHNCLGYSDEKIELFIAYDVHQVEHPRPADDDETIEVLRCSKDEVARMLEAGTITDVKTIVMLQRYLWQPASIGVDT
jgi:ADP-ribose pyrophosphatase